MARSDDLDRRPSPEALLAEAKQDQRGRLRIFLGAAPGVGKTYQMLTVAANRLAAGSDVVAGIIETHGRKETEALLAGLEIIPRRQIDYRGQALYEMDIDALLARHPQIALVDELAHTNVPGSNHPKRYLDIEDLLAAGIDVYTTLNVQHLESLNDVVAQITGIRIRETVPDRILDAADQIELIDLTPDALIQRLAEGKVYVPEQAGRALTHYFKPGNLTALRELALRRTAERVEEQMVQHMRVHAIAGPWAANERVLVCVSDHPSAPALVRYARRVADRLHAKWTALYIEAPRDSQLNEAQKDRVAQALRLAEALGGEAVSIPGRVIADDVVAYARANNVTHIITGKAHRSRLFEFMHGSVVNGLVRKAIGISVHVVADEALDEPALKAQSSALAPALASASEGADRHIALNLVDYAVCALIVALATGTAELISRFVAVPNISLVYLTAVLIGAVSYGLWPSLYISVLSALAYNFFFLPPLYTFTIADPANVLSLFFFFTVAIITSNLMARSRRQTIVTRAQAKTTADLYAFSRKIAACGSLDDLLWAAVYQIGIMLKTHAVILMPSTGPHLEVRAGYPPEDQLSEGDLAAAHWSWRKGQPAGRGSDTLPGGKWFFLPMRTERSVAAIVGLSAEIENTRPYAVLPPLFTPQERRLLDALVDQTAIAIERIRLVTDIDQARLQAETERLRAALLSSLSHDLRTPLASILGAITSLRDYGPLYDEAAREELLSTAQEETERLNRFVANLLDMTRLESGVITQKKDPVDLEDLVGTVLRRADKILAGFRITTSLPADLPPLNLDHTLLEHVLFNLLDNAAKYAPPGSTIKISAAKENNRVLLRVVDEGPGIAADHIAHIFDKFYRVNAGDRQRAGTGLGLSICRGFLQVMGGTIEVENRNDRPGAVFTIGLPVE